jgi:hypothetical protein
MADLFTATHCDRCSNELGAGRLMSWFTEETLCMDCRKAERTLRDALKEAGKGTMEGCGYVPEMPKEAGDG